jgi:hypothetical protein
MGFLDRFRKSADDDKPVEKVQYQTTEEVQRGGEREKALETVERVEYSEPTTRSARVAVKRVASQVYREARGVGGAAQGIAREVMAKKRVGAAAFVFGRGKQGKGKKGKRKGVSRGRYTFARGYVARQFQRPQRVDARQYYDGSVRDVSNSVGPQSEVLELPQHFGSTENWHRASSVRLFDGFGSVNPFEASGGARLPRFFDSPKRKKKFRGVFG